jgi:Fe-S cluster assembly protein SufD
MSTTAQETGEASALREAWESAQGRAAAELPRWAAELRERAFESFERQGFPTTDLEDWKYTNVAPIARENFTHADVGDAGGLGARIVGAGAGGAGDARQFVYPEAERCRLVFVNGVFSAGQSALDALPAGVVVSSLRDALAGEFEPVVREHLGRLAGVEQDAFAALNAAHLGAGAFVFLPEGSRVESPLQLLFVSDAAGARLAVSPRLLVVAGRGSEATIVEGYESASDSAYFTNAVAEVFVKERARLTHYKVQREGESAFHVATTAAELGRSAAYDLTTVTLGARLSRHGIAVRMPEEGAECWVDGLYLVGGGQHADTHSIIDHVAPRCVSHQLYKGILDGRSRAVFNGRVFVRRDAQQTDARQTNKNLLLSPEARVDTKPQLEIFADDVKCSHGATVGQLEEEELFYLRSRGLHDALARNLLTYGFAEELVTKIKIDSIRRQLDETILNRLQARLEA